MGPPITLPVIAASPPPRVSLEARGEGEMVGEAHEPTIMTTLRETPRRGLNHARLRIL